MRENTEADRQRQVLIYRLTFHIMCSFYTPFTLLRMKTILCTAISRIFTQIWANYGSMYGSVPIFHL